MQQSSFAETLRALRARSLGAGLPERAPSALTADSREAAPGVAFVALKGGSRDGHDYIPAALEAGASMVICERAEEAWVDTHPEVAFVIVGDTRASLPALAGAVYRTPSAELEVIGVTGTNGKTTTTFMLESLGRALGRATGVIGTISHRFPGYLEPAVNTTPGLLDIARLQRMMADAGVPRVAMEVSSHGLDQDRHVGVGFDVAIWTNLSKDHLDYHGSMAAYRAAKHRLFTDAFDSSRAMGKQPVAVLNAEDPESSMIPLDAASPVLYYAARPDAPPEGADALCADALRWDVDGVSGVLSLRGSRREFRAPVLGRHNLLNALGAAAACAALGAGLDGIAEALGGIEAIPGRMERVTTAPAAFVDYAHSPDALRKALEAVRLGCAGALWVVFGAGGDRDPSKRPEMGAVAAELADHIIITSDNPRSEPPATIADAILAGVPSAARARTRVEVDRRRAIGMALSASRPEDCVLVAGKGHETHQIIAGERRPFDDRVEVERAHRAREEDT